jgi:tetratricopeptide (TPR) repeat protein
MTIPTLTESDIRQHADPQSFRRGTNYYHRGAILDPVRQGNELRAECRGTQYYPYRVTVTLSEHGIAHYHCSCPRGGFCKHIVALLLTWVHEPDEFHVIAPLDELLAQRNREELIALIGEMIAREPNLARLLELPLGPTDTHPFDLEPFRRQVQYALTRNDPEWVARELEQACKTADHYLAAGNPIAAGDLYALILDKTVTHMEGWWVEWVREGDISIVLQTCAEGLDRCLETGAADEMARRPWLEALLEAELKDIHLGGVDLATPAGDVVLERATDEQWAWIEARLQQELERADEWTRSSLVRFMTRRREMTGRKEEADAFLMKYGTPQQRAFLLVRLGRVGEAIRIAEEHFTNLPGLVIQFADALVEARHGDAAVAYMRGQMSNDRHAWHYRPWLARHFQEHGNQQAALNLWQREFESRPSLQTYQTLRELATELGTWEKLRWDLLNLLDPSRHAALLVDIALEERDVDRALEIARQSGRSIDRMRWERLAQAAETDRPHDTLGIYRRLAEQAIAIRGRENYRVAAGYLRHVRDLCKKLDATAEWEAYLTRLRQEHRRLPALQDELSKAGL